eukprot:TRINITY_DN1012_c0_g1_i2.p1 TRINITY_DN1012_c0_g1~~TRINITY_DN1012_c0_g1_i2.p1  ORF type:complete len:475 (-),score=138.81 TRINITY_DN1012_c0_g1_i2:64-1488(-)
MSSNLLIVLVLVALSLVNAQNAGINTGEAYYALRFPDAGQASVTLPEALSADLPLSFSFEAWIMLPGTVGTNQVTTADGLYKTVVSRYTVRPDGTYHNRYADFNLQVQKNGDINFFMGSGLTSNFYGAILTGPTLVAGRWTHVAFTVQTPTGKTNPDTVVLYVDGKPSTTNWKVGNRQLHEDVPIHLGAYLNQDGDVKWWRGYMDEIRFWGVALSSEDIHARMNVSADPADPNLLAYYKCDSGALLVDSTSHHFDGQFVTAAGAIQYQISGVKLGFSVETARQSSVVITLTGVGSSPFSYVIESVPDSSVGLVKVGATTLFTDNLPYTLTGNTVTFVAGSTEGKTGKLTYYGTNAAGREARSTTVSLFVDRAACNPDACGVCNGDNSTCSCLPTPYKGYSNADLEKILLISELDTTLDYLTHIEMHLEQASDALDTDEFSGNVDGQLTEVQDFREVCLTDLHDNLRAFLSDLSK